MCGVSSDIDGASSRRSSHWFVDRYHRHHRHRRRLLVSNRTVDESSACVPTAAAKNVVNVASDNVKQEVKVI